MGALTRRGRGDPWPVPRAAVPHSRVAAHYFASIPLHCSNRRLAWTVAVAPDPLQVSQAYTAPISTAMAHSHSHDGGVSHSHAGADHGHTHEILDGPGSYLGREMPIIEGRTWEDRAFTIGIGG